MEQRDIVVLDREQPKVVVHPQPAPKQDQPQDVTPDMRILFNAFRL